jgi:hypothetical protein
LICFGNQWFSDSILSSAFVLGSEHSLKALATIVT